MTFLGIDFGWQSQPSGCAALDEELNLVSLTRCDTPEATLHWLDQFSGPAMAAVDAPLVIPNATGMRPVDRLAHVHLGRYDAGCYPANLGRPFAARVLSLSRSLSERGFAHAASITAGAPGRYQIEVHPHGAMVRLFQLDRIIKYKKGTLASRIPEMNRYRRLLRGLHPWRLPAIPTAGKPLKAVEDQLDAIVAAYVGWHWWRYGSEQNQVLGDEQTGYIVLPRPLPGTSGPQESPQ
ncbi:MAG: DUF429 domain-containing protein [Acidobacteria bacterium]|nr:DUF429 domain-containing protein [Acidobacteriota bacterium]